jgi:hypothetical protein
MTRALSITWRIISGTLELIAVTLLNISDLIKTTIRLLAANQFQARTHRAIYAISG